LESFFLPALLLQKKRRHHPIIPDVRCFCLKDQEYFPALTGAIDKAKSEIIMSFFLFKAGVHKNSYPDRVLSHLAHAAQRGVRVMILLENSGGHDLSLDAQNSRTKQLLEDKGVKIYFDSPRKTTHTKLVVIDQRFVLLGSHNLTQSALKYNNEISMLIDRPELATEARTYMLRIIREVK
jgi:phosphatidylserine/phosphatidylglycerophosphate/cardiolipin synthase-like enzyme